MPLIYRGLLESHRSRGNRSARYRVIRIVLERTKFVNLMKLVVHWANHYRAHSIELRELLKGKIA